MCSRLSVRNNERNENKRNLEKKLFNFNQFKFIQQIMVFRGKCGSVIFLLLLLFLLLFTLLCLAVRKSTNSSKKKKTNKPKCVLFHFHSNLNFFFKVKVKRTERRKSDEKIRCFSVSIKALILLQKSKQKKVARNMRKKKLN